MQSTRNLNINGSNTFVQSNPLDLLNRGISHLNSAIEQANRGLDALSINEHVGELRKIPQILDPSSGAVPFEVSTGRSLAEAEKVVNDFSAAVRKRHFLY